MAVAFDRKTLEEMFRQGFGEGTDCASPAMQKAMDDWFGLYFNGSSTDTEDPSGRLACLVVQKLCRACFAEYEAKAEQGFAGAALKELDRVKKKAMQLAMIGGEAWLKPVPEPSSGRMYFTVVRRDMALVLGRSASGEATGLGTACRMNKKGRIFTLLERRSLDKDGRLVIESRLFESRSQSSLGLRVPLATLPETAALCPKLVLPPLGGLGLVSLRLSGENCVDASSEGVSVYAAAAGLIHSIDRGERRLEREFENGASRVFASADLLRGKGTGRTLPEGLFVGLDDAPETTGITVYSPKLRVESFLERKAEQLRNLESILGLKRGLLGPVEAAQRTATEVTSSEGDYALTIADLRESWQQCAESAMELAVKLGQVYGLKGADTAKPGIRIQWGDGNIRTPN